MQRDIPATQFGSVLRVIACLVILFGVYEVFEYLDVRRFGATLSVLLAPTTFAMGTSAGLFALAHIIDLLRDAGGARTKESVRD